MGAWFSAHSLISLLALAALGTVFWVWQARRRLSLRPPWVLLLSLLHVAVGVGCVKLFAVLEAGSLDAAGNMSLFGAVFFLPLFYWLGARLTHRSIPEVFDVFVVPMVFTLACARVNCLLSGCCLGRLIPGSTLRWPTREAELLFYAVLLGWFLFRTRRGGTRGRLYPIYMIAYGAFRFVTEFFRQGSDSLLHLSHLWALICLILGAAFLAELRRRDAAQQATIRKHRRKSK